MTFSSPPPLRFSPLMRRKTMVTGPRPMGLWLPTVAALAVRVADRPVDTVGYGRIPIALFTSVTRITWPSALSTAP